MKNMLNSITTLALLALASSLLAAQSVTVSGGKVTAGNCWLEEQYGIPVLHLKGSPYQMGYEQGLLARHMIGDNPINPARTGFGLNEQDQAGLKKAAGRFEPFVPDDLKEQMRGVADGLGKPYEDVFFANVFTDAMFAMGCLNFAACENATPDGRVIHAASLEHGNILLNRKITQNGKWVHLAVYKPEDGHRFAMVVPGPFTVFGFFAINDKQLTAGVTSLPAKDKTLDGIPTWMLLRKVIQNAATIPEAQRIIEQTPRSWGASMTFADGKTKQAGSIEFSSTKTAARAVENGLLLETNRMADKQLYSQMEEGILSDTYEAWMDAREKRFTQLAKASHGKIDVVRAVSILRDRVDPTTTKKTLALPALANEGNLNSIVFCPASSQFWVAHDSVPMVFGEFVGFNLNALLKGENSKAQPSRIAPDRFVNTPKFNAEIRSLEQLAAQGATHTP